MVWKLIKDSWIENKKLHLSTKCHLCKMYLWNETHNFRSAFLRSKNYLHFSTRPFLNYSENVKGVKCKKTFWPLKMHITLTRSRKFSGNGWNETLSPLMIEKMYWKIKLRICFEKEVVEKMEARFEFGTKKCC